MTGSMDHNTSLTSHKGRHRKRSSGSPAAHTYLGYKLITVTTSATTATATVSATAFTATATATAAITAAAAGTFFTRPGQVNGHSAAAHGFAVQTINRLLGFFGSAHGNEPKPAGFLGETIGDKVCLDHRAECRKGVLQIVFGDFKVKISNV
jgi:hypothetical protein